MIRLAAVALCLVLLLGLCPRPLSAAGLAYAPELKEFLPKPADDTRACREAAVRAEQEQGLPQGLLLAIGQQESGRWDAATSQVQPWPFAANAAGESRFFQSRLEAVGYVAAQRRFGIQSIDVGCFQINLRHHPNAFGTLEEAFDPDANARYAAHFLKALYSQTGDWEAAIGRYHSATIGLGDGYKAAVMSRWNGRGSPVPRPVVATRLGIELVAGVIVQRPLAATGQIGAIPGIGNLPQVITPTGGFSRRM
jgi:soluble lytic murein transglycosylase-like protein